MTFQWLDFIILGIIFLSTVTGLFRGFIKEIVAILAWVIGIWLAYENYQTLAFWFHTYIHDKALRSVLSFILILFAVLLGGAIFNAFFHFVLKSTGLSGINRLLGMVFGALRGIIIVALIITFIQMTSLPYHSYTKNSLLYPKFKPLTTWLQQLMPRQINQIKGSHNVSANEA